MSLSPYRWPGNARVHAVGASGRTLCQAFPASGAARVLVASSPWDVTCARCIARLPQS